jgi:GT2 family glycosyltransferase
MQSNRNNICTIIVTYNPLRWINHLENYLESENLLQSVIFIDNGSTDGFKQWSLKKGYSHKIIFLDYNLGFGAANNIGIEIALKKKADYILLLNQDAWLLPGVISQLVAIYQKEKNVGIVTPLHFNATLNGLDSNFKDYLSASKLTDYISNGSFGSELLYVESKFINAAIWLLTADCIRNVGGFNPSFYHYGEDNEYCNRLLKRGYRILIHTKAIGIHDRENRDLVFDLKKEIQKCMNASKIQFFSDNRKMAFTKMLLKVFLNKGSFNVCILDRIKIVFRLISERKNLFENKYEANFKKTPFLNFE